jgi:hypothetical protein
LTFRIMKALSNELSTFLMRTIDGKFARGIMNMRSTTA